MSFVKNFIKSLIDNFKTMPIAIILAYIATILSLFIVSNDSLTHSDSYIKCATYFVVGYFLIGSLYLFKRLTIIVSGLLSFALLFIYGYHLGTEYFIFWSILLIVASMSIAIWSPFGSQKSINKELFNQALGVINALSVAIVLSTTLMIGVFISLWAFDVLFGVTVPAKTYGYIAVISFGVFGANYYLYQLRNIDFERDNTALQRLFARYILPIFTIGYFLILYAYTLKIIFIGSLPHGQLAWFILFFSLVALLCYLFLTPYQNRFKKYILLAIIPQAIMLLVALYPRLQQYSFTEARYMLMVYAIYLIVVSFYLLRKDNYKNFFILSTITLFFISISSFEVAKISQKQNFLTALGEYKNGNQSLDIKYKLSSTIDYLSSRWGLSVFEDMLPNIVKNINQDNRYRLKYNIAQALGFKYVSRYGYENGDEQTKSEIVYLDSTQNYGDISQYKYYFCDDAYLYVKDMVLTSKDTNTTITLTKNSIIVKKDTRTITIDLKEYIKTLYLSQDKNKMSFVYRDDNIDLKLVINRISLEIDKITDIRFIIFYK